MGFSSYALISSYMHDLHIITIAGKGLFSGALPMQRYKEIST